MGETDGISSLKAIIERLEGRLKRRLDAVVGSFWNVVAGLGRLPQRVVLGGQAVWAELIGLSGIVQEQSKDLLAAAEEATGAIVRLVGSVEVACENV